METKTVTLRLPQDIADYIASNGNSVTEGIKKVVNLLQRHERHADMDLRGIFEPKEWKFLVDSLNGTIVQDDFRFSREALVANNEDSDMYEGAAARWGVELKKLNEKCMRLSASQVEALYRRIEKYWESPDAELEQWSNF